METISSKGSLREGYTVENTSRSHVWLCDEPKNFGGADLGPAPSELLLSSLISCKLITMKMYAGRKGWDLQNAHMILKMEERSAVTVIEKSIQFEGNLNEEQQKRLTEISGRCPVAKMLSASIEFKIV